MDRQLGGAAGLARGPGAYHQLLLAQHVDRVSVVAAQARRLSVLRLAFRRLTR